MELWYISGIVLFTIFLLAIQPSNKEQIQKVLNKKCDENLMDRYADL